MSYTIIIHVVMISFFFFGSIFYKFEFDFLFSYLAFIEHRMKNIKIETISAAYNVTQFS